MKHHLTLAALLLTAPLTRAALSIPSDGSDGVFAPATSVEIDLSQATTGAWDASNAATPGKGRYDASKWAVVFKYSSVNIPVGVTVTFKNHPSYAPVVWLVSGGVNIAGTVNLRGQSISTVDAVANLTPGEPGPGGFRGGPTGPSGPGSAHGIGGGQRDFGSDGGERGRYAMAYGNPQILPLIGGSGGGANIVQRSAGGGGAILIGAATGLTLTGTIDVRGGNTTKFQNSGAGAGGAVRLIAEQVIGNGTLIATDNLMEAGRIRIETPLMSPSLVINPNTVAVPPASPPQIWPGATAPTVKVLSIDGVAAPADPTARLDTASDVAIAKNNGVDVIIQTTNFPTSGVVQVRDVKKYGVATWTNCTLHGTGNTFAQSNWKATITFTGGFTTLQARATVP
jgi:hypothetical protein